jgi:hypothetical protein
MDFFLRNANIYNLKDNAFASVPEVKQWLFFYMANIII